ncbi:MAG: hypothetical protein R3331_09210 [Sulfurospirillaceae bacterium]|nr:hypothetical protein [Sulfurospirillaceae bacterium]
MQNIIKQAYQAEVLIRKVEMCTVGTRYPFKDQVVITCENTYQVPDFDFFTYSQRIDICVLCENRIEALKLSRSLNDYFKQEYMLPLHVGVFQKPFTKDNQKSRKHFAYATVSAKDLLSYLPELLKDKKNAYVAGATNVESSSLFNGFDLTYQIADYRMEHFFMEEDFDGKPLDTPFYRLSLYTSTIIENIDDKTQDVTQNEELLVFEIMGESKSEIISLAQKLNQQLKEKKDIFTCKGAFPRLERDFYRVKLDKSASQLLELFNKTDIKKAS